MASQFGKMFHVIKAVLSAIALVLLTAIITYQYTNYSNQRMVLYQHNIDLISDFEKSGVSLDKAIASLNKAAASSEDLQTYKRAAIDTITEHIGDTELVAELIGQQNLSKYLLNLSTLNDLIESAKDRNGFFQMGQVHLNLIAARRELSVLAKKNATSLY